MKANSHSKARQIFIENRGILRASQAIKLGISPATLYAMRDKGLLDQERRGLYSLADAYLPSFSDLVQISIQVPKAVFCLVSALSFHDLTTRIPQRVYISLPRPVKKPRIAQPKLEVFWRSQHLYEEGIREYQIDGFPVRIYDPEKTICDCFYYKNRIELDTTIEALREYLRRRDIHLNRLVEYAKHMRILERMRPYIQALL